MKGEKKGALSLMNFIHEPRPHVEREFIGKGGLCSGD